MTKHKSKEELTNDMLTDVKAKITKGNVNVVLPLLEWTITKIDLIVAADLKKQQAKEAKAQNRRPEIPLLISRGEIWEAHLGYNVGSEQNESRPVLIIQNDGNNKKSPNTIIAPLSDLSNRLRNKGKHTEEEIIEETRSKLRDTEVLLPRDCVISGETSLLYPSILLCQNIREISKERLNFRVTKIDDTYWDKINTAICKSLGLA